MLFKKLECRFIKAFYIARNIIGFFILNGKLKKFKAYFISLFYNYTKIYILIFLNLRMILIKAIKGIIVDPQNI